MGGTSDAALEVKLFGRFEVWRENEVVSPQAWGRRKTQSLLKLLLAKRDCVFTQDQLIEALFPDLDPEKAVKNLRSRISELRRVLEPGLKQGTASQFVLKVGQGYCFSEQASCWLDTEEFQNQIEAAQDAEQASGWPQAVEFYQKALELYRGDYLAEDPYEEWTLTLRERWRELYLMALERLAECHARLGQYHHAIEQCQKTIALDRYREGAYRQLMRYYCWLGEQSRASQVYQRCRQALEELEVEPSPKTQTLYEQIKRQELPEPEVAPLVEPGRAVTEKIPAQVPRESAFPVSERRQLTVMVCSLAGFTALSEQLGPERLRDVLLVYREVCAPVIRHFEGTIAQYSSDRLLVYFGYPLAHADDPQRAVYAGLGMIKAMERLNQRLKEDYSTTLAPHVGIHTGSVVTGDLEEEIRDPLAIVGETPNLAARLHEIAEPNTVVISADTHKLIQGYFQCRDLGSHHIKGITKPVQVYQVLSESGVETRFELAVATGLTPLVGREKEVELLLDHWKQAWEGRGQILLITGEAGIGKSRLVLEFQERLAKEPHCQLECRGSPYHQNSAFYPVIDLLQQVLQSEREDSPEEKLSKLETALSAYPLDLKETVPLFASLLSIPSSERYPPLRMAPERQKQKALEALIAILMEQAEQQPVLLVVEDLHWIDPSTLELLTLIVDQVPTTRLCALFTYRPEQFQPPWPSRAHLIPIMLRGLSRAETKTMVEKVAGKALPTEVLEEVTAKTDGVPLFVEELTKMILESGLLQERGDHYELVGSLSMAIPDTLRDWLMARLDWLAGGKELAQLGATLGREFSYELLQAVSHKDEETLQGELAQLVHAEFLYQRGLPPQATYLFKHALIQEAAYHSLLKSKRRQYHQQIAGVLEERFPKIVETRPELLAHHYTEAGLIEQAIPAWQRAGQRATERSANLEAIAHLTKGLELLETLPETSERDQQELELQLALATPLQVTKGYAASEVERVYSRARELCQQVGNTPQLFTALRLFASFKLARAEHEACRELAEQMLNLAQRVRDPLQVVMAHWALGTVLVYLGEFAPAGEHFEQALAFYDPQQHHSLKFLYGQDPRATCLSWTAWALWLLGYPDQALKRSQEALALAQELDHPYTLAFTQCIAGVTFHLFRREVQATREWIEAMIRLATEEGFALFQRAGAFYRGWVQTEGGIAQMRQGLAVWQAAGIGMHRPYLLGLLAEAYGKAGKAEKGLSVLAEALEIAHSSGERYYEAELYRLRGELLRMRGEVEAEVEGCFHQAIEVARRQRARSWELRAAMSLSRLWQRQGKREEARQLLAEIYGWFTEGFDTPDLKEAKALLKELS